MRDVNYNAGYYYESDDLEFYLNYEGCKLVHQQIYLSQPVVVLSEL